MNDLVGRVITEARPMTDDEHAAEGWDVDRHDPRPLVLVLDDGTKMYPARDIEGNGPGQLFGINPDGETVAFVATEEPNDGKGPAEETAPPA